MSHLKLGFIRIFFFTSQNRSSLLHVSVSYTRIVRQYRMSHLKGNLGFHQKLCFTSQNLVPFLHVSVSYTRMVFPFRTSLSLSYDVPPWQSTWSSPSPDERALEDVSFGRGCCFVCVGNDLSYGQSLDLCHVYVFDETCKFELHCQFWYWMAALTERMNTWGLMWSVYMSTSSRPAIHLLDLLCSCTMDGTCIMPTGFVESTEVWGTVL